MGPRYFSATVRPQLWEYYNKLLQRPAFQKTLAKLPAYARKMIFTFVAKTALKIGAVVGLVGVGYYGYKKLKSGSV